MNGTIQETIYIDDRALPYYEYSETQPRTDCSDDDGHRECGLGGYENCPDNPANHSTPIFQEDNFEKNHLDPNDRGVT